MNLIVNSQVASILEMYLAEVTDRQIEREGTKLDKISSGDKQLGVLESVTAKKLWIAAKVIKSKAIQAIARAEEAVDDHGEHEFRREHAQLDDLADLCRNMAWFEIHESLGSWEKGGIGLRQGWIIVIPKEQKGPMDMLRQIGLLPPE